MTNNLERRLREGGLAKGDVVNLQRRLFLRHGLSFGALTMLSGCDVITNTSPVDAFLRAIGRFNDGVQAVLFNPRKLAPTYPGQPGAGRVSLQRAIRHRPESRRSTRPPGGCSRPASSATSGPGRSSNCRLCRREKT